MKAKIKLLTKTAKVPTKTDDGNICYDIYCNEAIELFPAQRKAIGTGIAIQPEDGWGIEIRERSGLGSNGLKLFAGECDNGYTGEYKVIAMNLSGSMFKFEVGDRIAQIKPIKINPIEFEEVDEFELTDRGEKGFGSSGR